MKNLLFIVNPVSGKRTAKSNLFDAVNTFCKNGYNVTTAITQYRGHATELAKDAKDSGYDLVVCMGGDGTLNEVINGLLSSPGCNGISPLPIGYIPAGSTNDFAETLGLSSRPADMAARIAVEKPFSLDTGEFTQIAGNSTEIKNFSYIASFGAFAGASYDAPQALKNRLGHLAYILQGATEISKIRSHKVSFTANGKDYSGNYIYGSISNTTSVAGIVKLKNKVDLNDGLFEVIMVKKPATPHELNAILQGIATSKFNNKMFDFIEASEITLNMGKSIPWTLDGEKADGAEEIKIRSLHSAITLYK